MSNINEDNKFEVKKGAGPVMVMVQFFVSTLLAALNYYILLLITFFNGTCYTLPLDYGNVTEGRLDSIVLILFSLLFWSPLLFRNARGRYLLLTGILLTPIIYYWIVFLSDANNFHNGLCW